jgi:hypothetical protein
VNILEVRGVCFRSKADILMESWLTKKMQSWLLLAHKIRYSSSIMTRFLLNILVVLILWFPASSIAGTLNRIHIKENDKGITLRVNDASLGKVLQSIGGKTGIQFHTSPSVLNDRITINLNAPDWQTAMKQLLKPYDRIELWSPNLHLTKIHVLSRVDTARVRSGRPQTNYVITEADRRSSSELKRKQLLKLARGKLDTPLAKKLFEDSAIKEYLKQYDIHSPEDMNDAGKARSIRIKARKLLLELDKAKEN